MAALTALKMVRVSLRFGALAAMVRTQAAPITLPLWPEIAAFGRDPSSRFDKLSETVF
jgi:hypothetical protein